MADRSRHQPVKATESGADFLGRVPLFSELPTTDLQELASRLRWARYTKGEVIIVKGDPGNSLFLIESGTVKLALSSAETGKEFLLELLGPGSFFGELALLDGEPRSVDVIAVEACQLCVLMRTDFLEFLEHRTSVAAGLLSVLSRRLRRDADVLEGAAFLDLPGRLGRAMLQIAESLGEERDDGSVVVPARLTQAELAGLVGSTRESVNRWLVLYQRMGWVSFTRGQLTILQPEKLRERSR